MSKLITIVLSCFYLYGVSQGLSNYYFTKKHADWQGVAEFINQHEQPGDIIAISGIVKKPHLVLSHYYEYKINSPIYVIDRFLGPLNDKEIQGIISQIPKFSGKMWLVYRNIEQPGIKRRLFFEQKLGENFNILGKKSFNGFIDVFLINSKLY